MSSRLAVVDYDSCHPDKCGNMPCVRFCPVNRGGTIAIEPSDAKDGKPVIYESTCISCGICIKKCPFDAIYIVNIPSEIEKKVIHRYGENEFKLYGLPIPIRGKLIGILGRNGSGKSTALRILGGEIIPNFGEYDRRPDWDFVLSRLRGTELYGYFRDLVDKNLRIVHKIQYVEYIPSRVRGYVKDVLARIDERGVLKDIVATLNMGSMLDKKISSLSGGELQKLAIAAALCRDADVYLFDEPSSYLDIRERLNISIGIRNLLPGNSYTLIVEHDLAVLDYLSDYVVLVFGEPGAYGYFSKLYGTGAGIGHYLRGFLPAENMMIRKEAIVFPEKDLDVADLARRESKPMVTWRDVSKKIGDFTLKAPKGEIYRSELVVAIGPNAIGKSTFMNILANNLEPDSGYVSSVGYRISYKPQFLSHDIFSRYGDTVEEVLRNVNPETLNASSWIHVDIVRKLRVHKLLPKPVKGLSGGELQKLAITLALATEADLYVLDEPSAHIDVEDRIAVARTLKRVVENRNVAGIIVEHDLTLVAYLATRVIVFDGEPGVYGVASEPMGSSRGLNRFLKNLDITVRKDPKTKRPRINKPGSNLDRYQRSIGEYFYMARSGESED